VPIRQFIFAGCFGVATAAALAAQSSATGTIPAQATIGAVVILSNPSGLDFGTLLAGQTSSDVPPSFSGVAPHAGSIELSFTDPVTLNVTIDPGGELANQGHTLATVLACGLGGSSTDANALIVACQNQHIAVPATRTTHTVFIFVGGRTTAPGDAPAGVYNGTVTVRVTVTTA
jgi:hypothetical protein